MTLSSFIKAGEQWRVGNGYISTRGEWISDDRCGMCVLTAGILAHENCTPEMRDMINSIPLAIKSNSMFTPYSDYMLFIRTHVYADGFTAPEFGYQLPHPRHGNETTNVITVSGLIDWVLESFDQPNRFVDANKIVEMLEKAGL